MTEGVTRKKAERVVVNCPSNPTQCVLRGDRPVCSSWGQASVFKALYDVPDNNRFDKRNRYIRCD